MNNRRISILATALLVTAPIMTAQLLPPAGTAKTVSVQPAATAEEQLKHARELAAAVGVQTDARRRFDALAETFANLNVIRATWPNDHTAVIDAAMLSGDLGLAWGTVQNSIDALTPVLPLVRGQAYEVRVERMLGEAHERAGHSAEAEQHLLAAEAAIHSVKVNRVEAEATLSALAQLYARSGRSRDAIREFHAIVDLPGQDHVNKAAFTLAALKQAGELRDDPNHDVAQQEYGALELHIQHARQTNLTPADARTIANIEADAFRTKQRQHF